MFDLSDFHRAQFDLSWSIFITRELGKNLWSCFRLVNISNRSSCCEFNTLYLYNKTATVHVECWLTIGICELCEKNRTFLKKWKIQQGFSDIFYLCLHRIHNIKLEIFIYWLKNIFLKTIITGAIRVSKPVPSSNLRIEHGRVLYSTGSKVSLLLLKLLLLLLLSLLSSFYRKN